MRERKKKKKGKEGRKKSILAFLQNFIKALIGVINTICAAVGSLSAFLLSIGQISLESGCMSTMVRAEQASLI